MLETYLRRTGLSCDIASPAPLNRFVEEALGNVPPPLSPKAAESLFTYSVPKLAEGAACARTKETENYSLLRLNGLQQGDPSLPTHPTTLRLWRLNEVVDRIQQTLGAEWVGIYRRFVGIGGGELLVKEAYRGAISRAEFPLTEEFAQQSNNAMVGLTGQAILVDDVEGYSGPYYACDGRVQSELCVPIFSPEGEVIGIIDVEAWTKRFFTREKVRQIAKVAVDLGQTGLLLS